MKHDGGCNKLKNDVGCNKLKTTETVTRDSLQPAAPGKNVNLCPVNAHQKLDL